MDKASKISSGKKKKGKSSKKKKKKLEMGNRVKLLNVTKKADEGKMGTITGEFNDRKKRWPITLDEDDKKVNIKAENLELVEEEAKAEIKEGDPGSQQADEEAKEEEVAAAAESPKEDENLELVGIVGL